jgi:ribonuclease-3
MDSVDFSQLETMLGVTFTDTDILREACTHRSYLNENRNCTWSHNERLEFLGDAVLELAVTDYLFKKYPDRPEGELTSFRAALVNTIMLSEVASDLSLGDFILLSRGEAKDVGKARQYILANAFEAVIGAIYLDQGYKKAEEFIGRTLYARIDDIVANGLWKDAKSHFQELAQEHVSITPLYRVVVEEGPDHDKQFTVGVFLENEEVAQGTGKSKQEAEQSAAAKALIKKGWTS